MNRAKPKQIVIRASEQEFELIKKKVAKSKLTQNEYLLKSALDKKIVVVEGVKELTTEVRRIGTNINQITKAINQGFLKDTGELAGINEELKQIWQLLRQLIQKQT